VSASMKAQIPSKNPSPIPMAWYGMPKKKPKRKKGKKRW
jgi:hypothetical protein